MIEIFQQIIAGGSFTPPVQKPKLSELNLNIVCDGDSWTYGDTWLTTLNNYVKAHALSSVITGFGVNGQTIEQMIADFSTQIAPMIDRLKANVLIYMEDVNAIYGGTAQTAMQTRDSLLNYASLAKTAGFDYVILMTQPHPRLFDGVYTTASVTPTKNIIHDDFIELMRITSGDFDVQIIFKDHTQLGGPTEQEKNSYWLDSLHPNQSGYNLLASWVFNKGILGIFEV